MRAQHKVMRQKPTLTAFNQDTLVYVLSLVYRDVVSFANRASRQSVALFADKAHLYSRSEIGVELPHLHSKPATPYALQVTCTADKYNMSDNDSPY